MNTIDTIDIIATQRSGGWRRDPVSAVFRLVWSMLALHGMLNLYGPRSLRENIIPIVVGALVGEALRGVVERRYERRLRGLVELADRAQAATAQATRPTPETAP